MSCSFCTRIAANDFDPLTADSYAVTFPPLHPIAYGHLLVVARRHIHHVGEDAWTAGQVMAKTAQMASRIGACDIVTSTRALGTQPHPVYPDHLHFHVIPRELPGSLTLPWDGPGSWLVR